MSTNLSRRTFFGMAAAAAAATAVPILTESQLAYAQRRRIARDLPPGAVRIDGYENPLGPCSGACAVMSSLLPEGGRYDDAIADLSDALKIAPENADATTAASHKNFMTMILNEAYLEG